MRFLAFITVLLFSLPSMANWQLVNDKSQINFITTKKNSATEVHQFTQVKGNISAQGRVDFAIDLTSVETNIPIRNERMQKFLFKTDVFPKATFATVIDVKEIEQLAVGDIKQITLNGDINLHGVKQSIETKVQLIKVQKNVIVVNSLAPIILQAKAFNLVAGVEKLQSLANLPSISHAVPVTFSLYYRK